MRRTLVAVVMALVPLVAVASPYEPADDPAGHVPGSVYNIYTSAEAAMAAREADRSYVAGMREHHLGAVTMAKEYLSDPESRHPIIGRLAEAIIANQEFEVAVLDDIGRHGDGEPTRVLGGALVRQAGRDGLEHSWQYVKHPVPGVLDFWLDRTPLSQRDVVFAKGMIIHHRAAVDMARAYNADPVADNSILMAMNRDIVIDQNYEIALMERLIRRYPGDAAAVVIDPATIPGMPHHGGMRMSPTGSGMQHHGGSDTSGHQGHR